MANKKRRFTEEEHEQLGLELQTIRDRLTQIICDISGAYPHKTNTNTGKALYYIDALRDVMELELFKEIPEYNKSEHHLHIYPRAMRTDYIRYPKPICPVGEVSKE